MRTKHVLSPNFRLVYKLSGRGSLNGGGDGEGDGDGDGNSDGNGNDDVVVNGMAATYKMNGTKNNIDSIASKE